MAMNLPEIEYLRGLSLPLVRSAPHPCPYLPGHVARELVAIAEHVAPGVYQRMMDLGFRRAGTIFYRPTCPNCRACQAIRVPVSHFRPSRSQRRVLKRNSDVLVRVGPLRVDEERCRLFERYQQWRHDSHLTGDRREFIRFLGTSPLRSAELSYWLGGRLVGVSVLDVCPHSLSSVYFYSEPELADRSLGVYSGLCEIEECQRRGLPYWYVGFYVAGCPKMEYKARFRPCELLGPDGVWRHVELPSAKDSRPDSRPGPRRAE